MKKGFVFIIYLTILSIPAHCTVQSGWEDPPCLEPKLSFGIIDEVDLINRNISVGGKALPLAAEAKLFRGTNPVSLASLAPVTPTVGQDASWRLNDKGQIEYLQVCYRCFELELGPAQGGGRWTRPTEGGAWRLVYPREELESQWLGKAERAFVVLDWEGKVRMMMSLQERDLLTKEE